MNADRGKKPASDEHGLTWIKAEEKETFKVII